jgi:hypothetical protein
LAAAIAKDAPIGDILPLENDYITNEERNKVLLVIQSV